MCRTCWIDYGSPKIINAVVLEAQPLINSVYEISCVGGDLHILVDDWNAENRHIDMCEEEINKNTLWEFEKEELNIERRCISKFREMTFDERISALALYEGIINE